MQANWGASVGAARASVVKIAAVYVILISAWVFMQSGIPFSLALRSKIDENTWLQTLNAWYFVVVSGWLLYLLVTKSLATLSSAANELRLRDRAIESSVNAIFMTDYLRADNPIVYVNPAFERMTGYTSAEVIGQSPRFLQGSETDQPELRSIRLALKEQRPCRVVLKNYRKDGRLYWNELTLAPVRNEEGEVAHYVGIQSDMTEEKRYQEELAHRAHYDSLTGLPNRNLLSDRISQACARAERHAQSVAIAFIDLDNFKIINDSLGHGLGDCLLQAVSQRLESSLREMDTVARPGGDEFVVVLSDQLRERDIAGEVRKIVALFAQSFSLSGRDVFITASIGIALYPQDAKDAESLVKNAELAMYKAKEAGRNTFQLFTAEMTARASERLSIENKLRRALQQDEFLLFYQPQVDLRTSRVTGAEALIRWRQPEMGLVSPASFIPLAEETGLIVAIGEWVVRTACKQNKAWQDAGLPPITIAVNISARQFQEKDFVDEIGRILGDTGLNPIYLELEVTEGAIMRDTQHAVATLQKLKEMGMQLAVDDFGTGYSSLSYLKRFPVDRLKIDQSFVHDITSDPDDAAIVQAIITLGHALDLRVIAEGTETEEQLAFLRSHQCDETQGFLFSRPVPPHELQEILEGKRSLKV